MTNGTITRRELRDPFDTMFERFFGLAGTPARTEESLLPVDLSETDAQVVVRAAVPGYRKEDVDVELHDHVLTIKAERKEETQEQNERYFRKELRFGAMTRRIALPDTVLDKDIKAELNDGVLTLRLNKIEKEQPRKIRIG